MARPSHNEVRIIIYLTVVIGGTLMLLVEALLR